MSDVLEDAGGAATAFIAVWRAREPEMAFAQVFCPRAEAARFALWGALVAQWREAALELSDPRPTQIKCNWWAEEALACAQAQPRHPLTVALAMPTLPWLALAQALAGWADADAARPVDTAAALDGVASLTAALVEMEAAVFGVPASEAMRRAVAVHLLGERLRSGREGGEGGHVPLALLARHGIDAAELGRERGEPALRDWAGELVGAMPDGRWEGSVFRRCRTAFDALLLRGRAAGRARPLSSLRTLAEAWKAARSAVRR